MKVTLHSQYLESKVLTASPHKLHLMLIEGAQRLGRQAEAALARGDTEAAAGPLLRALDIVGELLAGAREKKTALNLKLADFYWFLFRRLSLAKINSDAKSLGEVLKLLEYERQTWQLVCDRLDATEGQLPPIRAPRAATARFTLEA
jgi:flagellar protein FliS